MGAPRKYLIQVSHPLIVGIFSVFVQTISPQTFLKKFLREIPKRSLMELFDERLSKLEYLSLPGCFQDIFQQNVRR